eukprot:403369788
MGAGKSKTVKQSSLISEYKSTRQWNNYLCDMMYIDSGYMPKFQVSKNVLNNKEYLESYYEKFMDSLKNEIPTTDTVITIQKIFPDKISQYFQDITFYFFSKVVKRQMTLRDAAGILFKLVFATSTGVQGDDSKRKMKLGFNNGLKQLGKEFPPFNFKLTENFHIPIQVIERNIDLYRDQPDESMRFHINIKHTIFGVQQMLYSISQEANNPFKQRMIQFFNRFQCTDILAGAKLITSDKSDDPTAYRERERVYFKICESFEVGKKALEQHIHGQNYAYSPYRALMTKDFTKANMPPILLTDLVRCQAVFTDFQEMSRAIQEFSEKYEVTRIKNKIHTSLCQVVLNFIYDTGTIKVNDFFRIKNVSMRFVGEAQFIFQDRILTADEKFQNTINHKIYELARNQDPEFQWSTMYKWSIQFVY